MNSAFAARLHQQATALGGCRRAEFALIICRLSGSVAQRAMCVLCAGDMT